ncbi:anthocyanidin 3-O-glucosyltransferase 7 [Eucalyptus grandis]|uniref:anthocyanidin 3-O-glucosyltransferase 7 n=1 Tax=Eucalyptus grandis TaxID=71139 RepID=UPI00192E7B21|nr:anthocyanidin 3-O-glucosyltransferase 7 [Eucalyptus grandis]XP_039168970.1 anthocyanidin 3-O-glucosyltransferase 7 [Eucalyptus grandis]
MSSGKHVAVLAFPFACHPLPLANLLRELAETATNVHFSFLSTAKSNDDLFPHFSRAELPPNIVIYDIDDGLPASHHGATMEELIGQTDGFLKQAPKSFRAAINAAERDARKKVSCLFSDALLYPACEIAEQMHIPWVTFWVASPCFLSIHFHIEVLRQLRHRNSCTGTAEVEADDKALEMIPALSLFRMSDIPDEMLEDPNTSMVSSLVHQLQRVLPRAAAVIMNSYVEANPAPQIADLKSKFKILLHVGCRTVSFSPPPVLTSRNLDPTGCLMWLDTKDPRSVAYICFGTVAIPSPTELSALAEALESTGTSFLWSIKEHMMVQLPEGFLERTGPRGKIVSWAPQSQVLSHPACGAYVTHCGYNSVFESIAGGVPMICKPFWTDNMMNGRLVKEWWGIGVGVEGKTITKSGMVTALEVVLRSEDGKEMRNKVCELRERLVEAAGPGGSVETDFKTLVEVISTS